MTTPHRLIPSSHFAVIAAVLALAGACTKDEGGTDKLDANVTNDAATKNDMAGVDTAPKTDGAKEDVANKLDSGADSAKDSGKSDTMTALNGGQFVYISGYDPDIRVYTIDGTTGTLTLRSMTAGGTSPSYMAFSPNKKYAYALNEKDPGVVIAYSINQQTGALTKINEAASGGNGPAHLSVHPSGKWVLVANYGSGHVASLAIGNNGGVTAPLPANIHKPVNKEAHQIVSDASGKYLFVPAPEDVVNSGQGKIAQLTLNADTGEIGDNDPAYAPTANDARPRHLAFHPNGKWAYHAHELGGGGVVSWMYDATTGLLSDGEFLATVPSTYTDPNNSSHVVVHKSGKFVYVANRQHDSIVVFQVNQTTGRLSDPVWQDDSGIVSPRDFAIDDEGKFLVEANNQEVGTVQVYKIDQTDGKLTKVGSALRTGKGPAFVGFLTLP